MWFARFRKWHFDTEHRELPTGTDDEQIVTRIKHNQSHVAEYRKMSHISRMLVVRHLVLTVCMIHKDILVSHDLTEEKLKDCIFFYL